MKLLPILCEHCSAPIRVPDHVKFATCQHCGTRLQIESDGEQARVRVLDELNESIALVSVQAKDVTNAAQMLERESIQLRMRNDILRLERDMRELRQAWTREKHRWLKGGKEPVVTFALSAAVKHAFFISFGSIAASFLVHGALQDDASSTLRWVLIATAVAVALIVLVAVLRIRKARQYWRVRARYKHRWDSLQHQLDWCNAQLDAFR